MTREERDNAIRCLKIWIEREPYIQTYKTCLEALEQELSRDTEEIEEVIKCDADAEIKLKMISNIVHSKPYYFKAIEQEPSGDTISRQAVLDIDFNRIIYTTAKPAETVRQKIEQLPSFKPQPKTGHWIDRDVYDADRWKCSECGRTEPYKENYCPKCGAKMN